MYVDRCFKGFKGLSEALDLIVDGMLAAFLAACDTSILIDVTTFLSDFDELVVCQSISVNVMPV